MFTNELVSTVITTFKRSPDILMRAVNSVVSQSYPNWECIVVNDAPEESDLSSKIQKMLLSIGDERIHYIEHACNLGSNAARNTGLSAAEGTFIGFLDDDDTWAPKKLELQIEAFNSHPDAALVYGGFEVVMNGKTFYSGPYSTGVLPFSKLLEGNAIGPTSFPLMKSSILKKVGSFDPEQKCCQDYELWLRIVKEYPAVGISECLGTRYILEDSVFRGVDKFISADRQILSKYHDSFCAYPRAHGNHLLGKFLYLLREGYPIIALQYKLDAWRADPTNPNNLLPVMLAKFLLRKIGK